MQEIQKRLLGQPGTCEMKTIRIAVLRLARRACDAENLPSGHAWHHVDSVRHSFSDLANTQEIPMGVDQSAGLFRGWSFRMVLIVIAVVCFIMAADRTHERLQFAMNGVSASIEKARLDQRLPTRWLQYEGASRGSFDVRVRTADGKESMETLLLPRDAINTLMEGGQQRIVFLKNKPRRFKMESAPLPPFGVVLWGVGAAALAAFLYALRR